MEPAAAAAEAAEESEPASAEVAGSAGAADTADAAAEEEQEQSEDRSSAASDATEDAAHYEGLLEERDSAGFVPVKRRGGGKARGGRDGSEVARGGGRSSCTPDLFEEGGSEPPALEGEQLVEEEQPAQEEQSDQEEQEEESDEQLARRLQVRRRGSALQGWLETELGNVSDSATWLQVLTRIRLLTCSAPIRLFLPPLAGDV